MICNNIFFFLLIPFLYLSCCNIWTWQLREKSSQYNLGSQCIAAGKHFGKASKQLQDAMDYQKDVLQPEDVDLCIRVQKGLKSKGYNQGRFVIDKEWSELSEHAVHHFHGLVLDAYAMAAA